MIKVKQTIYTSTDGNCLAASLASILEINIDDFPQLPNNKDWYPQLQNYLHSLGWNLVLIEGAHTTALRGYHLIIGDNPTSGLKHCVVAMDGEVVFDPSPYRTEFSESLKNIYYGIISKLFL